MDDTTVQLVDTVLGWLVLALVIYALLINKKGK